MTESTTPPQEIIKRAAEIADAEFTRMRDEKSIPGVAFGLLHDGKLVYTSGIGEMKMGSGTPPNDETVFRIASMTKSFTAQAILLLRDRGLIELHAPIERYLPWAATIGLPADSRAITVWDLLTMGAGFPTDDPWGDRQEDLPLEQFDALVAGGLTFNRPVNAGFEYSNLGYALLGRIIAQTSGEKYEDFVAREIIAPLEMGSTTFFTEKVPETVRAFGHVKFPSGMQLVPPVHTGAFTPMGGLHSSVQDLAKWVAHFQSGYAEAQMPARHIRSVLAPAEGEVPERVVAAQYGYGLFIEDDTHLGRFTSHSGGYPGFGSHMRWHKETGWAIIGLGNLTYSPMSIACAKVLNQIVWQVTGGKKPQPELHAATLTAMEQAESQIAHWDNDLADRIFAVNMDLDCPRADREAEFRTVGAALQGIQRVAESLTSTSKSHAKWRISGNEKVYEIEILISPEKEPKVQKITLKEIVEAGIPAGSGQF